ncbi:unnamed protein product [marine sediment metagenome]|uniref:Glycosyltransferase 2-like domain-containing protein n=1 Tax=marine sediment metagenome TaxID=412755 RepID=X1E1X7_9ZZZZ
MNKVLISSIVRNIEPWAGKFLNSLTHLKNGSLDDVDYLLIEGNSTDETYSLLNKWVDSCKLNVTLIKHDLPETMDTMDRVMTSIELISDIELYLTSNMDYIMLIDADTIEIPNNVLTTLIEDMKKCNADIIAPYVLIAGTDKFYDTYVFRMNNKKFGHAPPYTPDKETYTTPFEVDSVGTCLLFKSSVFMNVIVENKKYREEYQKLKMDGYLGLCKTAKALGYLIFADPTVRITHANLTTYGLRWHDITYWYGKSKPLY